ncbi:glycerophosphodiester phosphodiesterase [Roseateles sp. DC23W]|uniref:Glycerophosphodiester phosphodiesterase n=1 Tax=Pelomonas dachongensis TaxID=3299029 RepID=A0ABW7EUS0_9BURK
MPSTLSIDNSGLQVLGHRGAILHGGPHHENSAGAFQEALDGADGFETDACVDADGEVFLVHEAKYVTAEAGVVYCLSEHLDQSSQQLLGNRRIDQLRTAEMLQLRLRDGSALPALQEAIRLVGSLPGKLLDIEIKGYETVLAVVQIVDAALQAQVLQPSQVLLSTFNHPALSVVRERLPQSPVGAIFLTPDQPSASLFPWHPGSAGSYTPLTAATLRAPELQAIGPDIIVVPEEMLCEATLDLVSEHLPQARLMCWVFTERKNHEAADLLRRLLRLQSSGRIAGVMVDNPRDFKRAARAHGIHLATP